MRNTVIALALLTLAAGCQRHETEQNTNTITTDTAVAAPSSSTDTAVSTDTTASGTATAPMTPPSSTAPLAATQVRVELQEYEIRMPQTLPAGKNSLLVVNSGKGNHGLIIEGNGARFGTPEAITRGDSTTLDVDLKPGAYNVYCPVDDHKGKGMSRTISVQ